MMQFKRNHKIMENMKMVTKYLFLIFKNIWIIITLKNSTSSLNLSILP
jgi:hypothetical protein